MVGPGTFFVTKCLEPRKPLIDNLVASEICSVLSFYSEKKLICLGAFVVMLDHWHAVLATADGKPVSQRMQNLGQWLDRRCGKILSGQDCEWQDGFYETRIRSARQFQFVCGYIEENPVRAGLVKSLSDWKWSSAHSSFQGSLSRPGPGGLRRIWYRDGWQVPVWES